MLVVLTSAGACSRASAPHPHDAPGITMGASPGNRFVKAYAPAEITALVRVEAAKTEQGERPPANVALVVDTSGSMDGRALEDARAASLSLLDALGPKDRLAVVAFHAKTEVLLPSTPLDDADLPALRAAIGKMRAQGTTDMAGGLRAGLAEVMRAYDAHAVNRVILLGDGVPNDEAPIDAIAREAAEHHVAITALGLGRDYNETLMGKVALETGGRFHYVSESAKVAAFFHDEVTRVHDAYARNARLVITPGPGIVVESVVGQEMVQNGATVEVVLGDISLGDRRDLIVKVHAAPHKDGTAVEVLDASLRFTEGDSGEWVEKSAFLGVRATTDDAQIAGGRDVEVEHEEVRMQDAAKTVEDIKRQREAQQPAKAPSPVTGEAPMPAPTTAPSTAPAAAIPDVQVAHDQAMRVLQEH
jgi:Ca-activated chloride channel family protein